MARFVKRRIPSGSSILEIGCGTGANLKWLYENGYEANGIDVSAIALDKIRQSRFYPEICVLRYSATEIPFDDKFFDCVIDVCCLQHLKPPDVRKALNEAYRVLRSDGWIFSIMATPDHSPTAIPQGVYTEYRSKYDVLHLFLNAGFGDVRANPSRYTDEIYGTIEHWLVQGRKKVSTET